jgi:LVIVD repeat-containing protein
MKMGRVRSIALKTLLAGAIALQAIAMASALPGDSSSVGPTHPGTIKQTTPETVAQANAEAAAACVVPSSPACVEATENAQKEAASLAGVNDGTSTEGPPPLPEVTNPAIDVVKSANMTWISNTRGTDSNFAGLNFIHYEDLGYDFMFGDGTGGLSIWSLQDPAHPLYISSVTVTELLQPADEHGPADTATRFWEGENITVDPRRKLVFLARDPRSFGNSSHPNGRTGLYIIDVKDPWNPRIVVFAWVPAGHTATCINDCRYIWSMGPANNGSGVSGQPQDAAGVLHPEWSGVPVFVSDVRDIEHPYLYAQPVDLLRNNNHTAYVHSADVDQNGIVWTSGFGAVRGFWTRGRHHDPVLNVDRWATATDPIPYAGGSVISTDPVFATSILEHNSFHVTQAPSDTSPRTVTGGNGVTYNKTDLQYITQENVVSCTSTSGGGSGPFVVASLEGSYNGEDWAPTVSASNKFFITKIGAYSAKNNPGENPSAGCSAHWFTVLGDMVAIAFYGQGTRILDMSDPTSPTQVGHFRVSVYPASNASAAYWHNGYIYVADYSRGVDVLQYTGQIKGVVQPKDPCWNSCGSLQLDSEAGPPVTTATLTPPAGSNGTYVNPTVTLSAELGPGAGPDAASQLLTEYNLDGAAAFTTYTGPFQVTAPGWHTLLYRSFDQSDNVREATKSLSFEVSGPTVARIASFSARPSGRAGVRLSWRTVSELNTLGFNVLRFAGRTGVKVNRPMIAAKRAGRSGGASYRLADRHARSGVAYTYRLQVVKSDGSRVWSAAARVG